VDVENIRPVTDIESIIDRFFSAQEGAALRALPVKQRQAEFFHCWTLKEAYLKAMGAGLAQPLDQFDVLLASGEPVRLLPDAGRQPEAASQWSLHSLIPAHGYVAAVVVAGHEDRFTCWQWS
jgi:4'-phosphopantetheinyl transferase